MHVNRRIKALCAHTCVREATPSLVHRYVRVYVHRCVQRLHTGVYMCHHDVCTHRAKPQKNFFSPIVDISKFFNYVVLGNHRCGGCCTCRFSRDVVDGSAVWIASIARCTCCNVAWLVHAVSVHTCVGCTYLATSQQKSCLTYVQRVHVFTETPRACGVRADLWSG